MNNICLVIRKILSAGLSMILVCLLLALSSPALADVGVRPILPGGSSIEPQDQTPIQMSSELVTMDIRLATESDNAIIQLNPQAYGWQFQPVWFPAVAEVNAVFTMTNPTDSDITLDAWFPLASALETVDWEINPDEIVPRIQGFQVAVNGVPLEYSVTDLPNPKGSDRPPLPWASFPVTFPAGSDTIIQVDYLIPLQPSVKGRELALYYIFQTGAGWDGPIGKAELVLNLPYPASEGSLARIDPTHLQIPYSMAGPENLLSLNATLDGSQARWTWTDFEPGPQDDFAIWLADLLLYQQLESARAAIEASPQDGQAWLGLARTYRSLGTGAWGLPTVFAGSYLTPGVEAYQKAAELLPDHPEPHAGIAMLSLAPYMDNVSTPSEVMGLVQEQLLLTRQLESAHPNLAEQAQVSSMMVDDALNNYFYKITATAITGGTATAITGGTATVQARQTETAATPTITDTPTPFPTATSVPGASYTPYPPPVTPTVLPTAQPAASTLPGGLVLVIEIVIFAIVGLLVYRFLVRRQGKE